MRAGVLLLSVATLAGCSHAIAIGPRVAASTALVAAPSWSTLSAEHRVTVTVPLAGGKRDVRTLRGLIAVARPDRFRLRALGPAGISLFDLLFKGGRPIIVSAIRKPSDGAGGQALADITESLAADLACAYALDPAHERTLRLDGDRVVIEEPGRTVRLSRFAGERPTWHHAEIDTDRYHVRVDVTQVEIEPTLDPALWAE